MMRKQKPTRRLLCLEALEDRCLLSAGALDTTFGSGGLVTTNLGTQNLSSDYAVAIYHNQGAANEGKIVAAGNFSLRFAQQDIGIVRYNMDGSLDTSFGGSGQVTTSFGNTGDDGAHGVKIQPDGKVVVAGFSAGDNSDFAVVRYNADGSLDKSFGSKGKALTDINHSMDFAWTMGLQSDGKIVLAGTTNDKNNNSDLAVVRYNANGSLDTSFGTGGKVTRHFAAPLSVDIYGGMDMDIDSSTNKVVVVARGPNVVVRLNTNGSPDVSFGSNGAGYVSFISSTQSAGPAVAIQTDGRIVVTAPFNSADTATADIELTRFNPDGSLDATFGSGGTLVAVVPTTNEFPGAVTIQPDGKIVVAGVETGASTNNIVRQFMVARYNPDGSQDTSFGVNGIAGETVVTPLPYTVMDVALEPDGRIVVAGPGLIAGNTNFALVRFLGDAAPLSAASTTARPVQETLTATELHPLLSEALARWQSAGVDTSALHGIDVRIADLGGATLGLASGNTIWLDINAAGWGWFVDPTPADDSEFTTPGNQGEMHKMDLLTVLDHEFGHLLGLEHSTSGVMQDTLATGTRRMPGDAATVDQFFAAGQAQQSLDADILSGLVSLEKKR